MQVLILINKENIKMMQAVRFASKGLAASLLSVCLVFSGVGVSGCNSSWINTAINDIPVVLQIVTGVVSIVSIAQGGGGISPQMSATLQSGAAQATADLKQVQQLIASYQAAEATAKPGILGQIDSLLTSTSGNLAGILAAAHIENQDTQVAITAAVTLALTTVAAIQSLIPPQTTVVTGVTAPHTVRTPRKPASPKQLKNQFNTIVEKNFPQVVIK
jgi:hypothetical protein